MNPTEVMRAQLVAAQASIMAALALLGEPDVPPAEPVPGAPCAHPVAKRRAAPVGGDAGQFLCGACHTLVTGKDDPDGA